jgi:hypothetical protein
MFAGDRNFGEGQAMRNFVCYKNIIPADWATAQFTPSKQALLIQLLKDVNPKPLFVLILPSVTGDGSDLNRSCFTERSHLPGRLR